jgi:ElaB/YqjD/DUF883 family membrane-anchored ribosome-binding protein
MADAIKDMGKDLSDAGKEIGKDVKDAGKEVAKDAKDLGKEVMKDASKDYDTLRNDFEALKKEMGELVGMIKSEASSKVSGIKEDLSDTGGKLSEQLRKLLEKSGDATQSAAQSATHTLEERVVAHPMMSLLSAFGVGLLVARLMERR